MLLLSQWSGVGTNYPITDEKGEVAELTLITTLFDWQPNFLKTYRD